MLSSNAQMTPRPRPPAKMRRSTLHSQTSADGWPAWSPPPYAPFPPITRAHAHPTLLGSPITATSQLIHLEEVHEDEENLQEKSKEELEELLRRASEIIKEREQELDLTSETCKTLAENNAALKARNDSLISRLPPSQPVSPLASPSYQPGSCLSPAHNRTTSLTSRALMQSPNTSVSSGPGSVRRRPGHSRRISTTPAELAALADQNAELLTKLADLEAEASRAEQAGKRRLRNLETEIEALRDELERARDESRTLEESVNAQAEQQVLAELPKGVDKQIVKMFKRLSREAKVRELKAKTRPWEPENSEGPKDFAPENLTPGLPFTSKIIPRKVSAPNLSISTSLCHPSSDNDPSDFKQTFDDSPLSSVPPSSTSTISPNAREQALVSQLLLKIRELEETNAVLAENHLKASLRLKEAQTESESVRMLCEFIRDEVEGDVDLELEVFRDDEGDNDHKHDGGLVKAEAHDNGPTELRRSESGVFRVRSVSRKASLDLANHSTRHNIRLRKYRSVDSLSSLGNSPTPPAANVAGGQRNFKARKTVRGLFEEEEPRSKTFESPTLSRVPSVQEPDETIDDTQCSLDTDADDEKEEGDSSFEKMTSLGSELGLHLDGLGTAGLRPPLGLGHTRTDSIMELLHSAESGTVASMGLQTPVSPFPSMLLPSQSSVRGGLSRFKDEKEEEEPVGRKREAVDVSTSGPNERIIYPRLRRAKSSAVFGSRTPRTPTIQSSLAQRLGLEVPLTPTAEFTSANEEYTMARNNSPQPQTRIDKLRALLLEVWLWMYFAAVIAVFVFSAARKGPKVVLSSASSGARSTAGKGGSGAGVRR